MKRLLQLLVAIMLCGGLTAAYAQPGPPAGGRGGPQQVRGPSFGGATAKLFGDNSAFTATMEMQMAGGGSAGNASGKLSVSDGKSRFEVDITRAGGPSVRPENIAQLKAMGMDTVVIVARPDKKTTYNIYPGMNAYYETVIPDSAAGTNGANYKLETRELGRETVDGHDCVKNQVTVTDDKGHRHVSTVWNATDLKNFPVKIETAEGGGASTMLFRDIKLVKPDATLFVPPSGATKYDTMQNLLIQEMMKRRGGGA